MAMNRNTAVTIFTIIGLAVGMFLGWLFFAPKKPKTNGGTPVEGSACTKDGKAGTIRNGVCVLP